jgi:hypothetical protein
VHGSPILIVSSSNLGRVEGLGVAKGVGASLAVGFRVTPLFQTNFVPCFTQVYLALAAVLVIPALAHLVPAIDAEKAGNATRTSDEANEMAANFLTRAMNIA